MTPNERVGLGGRSGRVMAVLVAGIAPWLTADRAEAQWGYGGYRGLFNPETATTDYLNQRSLLNGQAASAGQGVSQLGANPDAYWKQARDPAFSEKYDYQTRVAIEESYPMRTGRRTPAPTRSPVPPEPKRTAGPSLPLSSFYNRFDVLEWPADAPTMGDLGPKRATSDTACTAVLDEYKLRGVARVATVTEARARLLDYGRPALHLLEVNTTPRISDTFHLFLLSLYDSLKQAATPATTPASPPLR